MRSKRSFAFQISPENAFGLGSAITRYSARTG